MKGDNYKALSQVLLHPKPINLQGATITPIANYNLFFDKILTIVEDICGLICLCIWAYLNCSDRIQIRKEKVAAKAFESKMLEREKAEQAAASHIKS